MSNDRIKQLEESIKTLGEFNQDMIVAMQAAIIEWKHGAGPDAALKWIANTLSGPGFLPDFEGQYGKEPQAWFDSHCANPLPTCKCGRPSNIGWMGQGFCSENHYREARAASLN